MIQTLGPVNNFEVVDEKYDLFGCLHQYFFHKPGYVTYVLFDTVENKHFCNKYDNDLYGPCPEELLEQKNLYPVSVMVVEPEVLVPEPREVWVPANNMLIKCRKDPKDLKCALVHMFGTKPGLQREGYCSFLFGKVFTSIGYINHDAIYSCGRLNNNVFKLRSREVNNKEKMTEDDNFYYSELEGNP